MGMTLDQRALWTVVYVLSFWRSRDNITVGLITAAIGRTWRERLALALLAVVSEIVT